MNHSEIYSRLNAKLTCIRQSYGGKAGRFVALTGWSDQMEKIDGALAIRVFDKKWGDTYGGRERERHLDMIRKGMASVVVKADPLSPKDRKIKSIDKDVFIGGELVDHNDCTYLTLTKRVDSAKINEVFEK